MEKKHTFALLSIIRRSKRTEVSTKTLVLPEKWMPGFGRVKGNGEESKRLNLGILNFEHQAREIYHRFIERAKIITLYTIKNELFGMDHNYECFWSSFG